jgi:hypothetical protein
VGGSKRKGVQSQYGQEISEKVMKKNPYWEISDWHLMNLAFKKNGHSGGIAFHVVTCSNLVTFVEPRCFGGADGI